jgi:branched-chain amino acid transport system ATP-binding protein
LGLAPIIVSKVFDEIRQLKALGTTILLNEQFANEALDVADRAIVMKLGHVVLAGSAEAVRSDRLVQEAYLGV